MREKRLHLAALVLFAALAVGGSPLPAASPVPAPSPTPTLPDVAAAPPARPSDQVLAVYAHLQRYARRSGLTDDERLSLARCVVRESRRHRMDPALVLAVMHVESRFDTYAVSNKDAMGLMQILPSTGAWLAPQVGVTWYGPQTLFDPEANVRIGVAYLRQLTDRYDGRIAIALAAYNWGPGAIDRFIARGRPLPQEYAQLVLAAYGPRS
jgi:soluble lytic murein transglycosylase-like protein